MSHTDIIVHTFVQAVDELYHVTIDPATVQVGPTNKGIEGDYTIVLFPYLRLLKEKPEAIGEKVGAYFLKNTDIVDAHNTVKGFFNLSMGGGFYTAHLKSIAGQEQFGHKPANGEKVMVEFSSPNTNKPLHLGHIRNILLGWSCSQILEANGYEVVKVQVINDRGIAICKSMLAWEQFSNGVTPQDAGEKPDHFVGKYYVLFEQKFQQEYTAWQESPEGIQAYDAHHKGEETHGEFFKRFKNNYFNTYSDLGRKAKAMLLKWEDNDQEVRDLWLKMNNWVYEGFETTYDRLGVSFDKLYYESDTYLLGKDAVNKGIDKGLFYTKEDGSVWIDLSDVKMDQKIVLRSDGTSVYITQDIGTAMQRYEDFGVDKMVYTVADEQDYHFKVLFEILKRFEEPYADGLHHLSYGMVDLTTGKMKSREGTVVDADDLMKEVIEEAAANAQKRGELAELDQEEREDILRKIGMAALKFFIIKVNPKKRMTFNPTDSLDMQGQTGPYVQNAYVRVQSVYRKGVDADIGDYTSYNTLADEEKALVKLLLEYPSKIEEAGQQYDPSTIANYAYNLAKEYHRFYHGVRILKAESSEAKSFRLTLSRVVADILEDAMQLLGIEMPNRM